MTATPDNFVLVEDLPLIPGEGPRARHYRLLRLINFLRANSGQWVQYPFEIHYPAQVGNNIRTGRMAAFRPAGDFQTAVRGGVLFVRHVDRATP